MRGRRRRALPDPLIITSHHSPGAHSKRTDAYLTVGFARNKSGSNLGLNGFGSTAEPGTNQTGVVLGLRHNFYGPGVAGSLEALMK